MHLSFGASNINMRYYWFVVYDYNSIEITCLTRTGKCYLNAAYKHFFHNQGWANIIKMHRFSKNY